MKLKLKFYQIIVLLLLSVFFSTAFKAPHPIKLTASLVEYNPKTKRLRMECRVFIDDFASSINKTLTKDIDPSDLSKEDKDGIEAYFKKHYTLMVNDKTFPLKFKTSTVMTKYNVLTIKFYEEVVNLDIGDQICIKNSLFFEEFGKLQSNRITARMPPFFPENNYETTFEKFVITLNL